MDPTTIQFPVNLNCPRDRDDDQSQPSDDKQAVDFFKRDDRATAGDRTTTAEFAFKVNVSNNSSKRVAARRVYILVGERSNKTVSRPLIP